MKNYKFAIAVLFTALVLGCSSDSDTEDVSSVTNFAVFDLKGDSQILLKKGQDYVEPGADATESGQSVGVTTSSIGQFRGGSLNTDVSDFYNVSYSATNTDGFTASANRTVIVSDTGDLINDLSGLYISNVSRNGTTSPQYQNLRYILIWKNADGSFQFSDAIGGWYIYGRALGVPYAAQGGKFTVNGPNNFTYGPSFPVGVFGGTATIKSIVADPVSKTINLTTDWKTTTDYTFKAVLTQVQL